MGSVWNAKTGHFSKSAIDWRSPNLAQIDVCQ
jgi:hypothetical protein